MSEGYAFATPITVERPTFEPLPYGTYIVCVASADVFERDFGSTYPVRGVNLKFEVVEGDYRGRYIFDQLRFEGCSDACRKRSENRITALAWAAGLSRLTNSAELVDKIVLVDVEIEQREGYEPRNQIRRYRKYEPAEQAQRPVNNSPQRREEPAGFNPLDW